MQLEPEEWSPRTAINGDFFAGLVSQNMLLNPIRGVFVVDTEILPDPRRNSIETDKPIE
jgi:hypothetical protein